MLERAQRTQEYESRNTDHPGASVYSIQYGAIPRKYVKLNFEESRINNQDHQGIRPRGYRW
jgi:hypothetical protein